MLIIPSVQNPFINRIFRKLEGSVQIFERTLDFRTLKKKLRRAETTAKTGIHHSD